MEELTNMTEDEMVAKAIELGFEEPMRLLTSI